MEGPIGEVKRRFRRHVYEVEYTAEERVDWAQWRPDLCEPEQEEAEGETRRVALRLHPEVSSNELIAALLEKVQLLAFREILPSMNDIFISQVQRMQKGGDNA